MFPKCKFPPPSNRFNILPGHWWDGVDRSNGYEKQYMKKINENEDAKLKSYKIAQREL